MTKELAKTYNPKEAEEKWYDEWIKKGYFHAENTSKKPAFSIVIPPPNVTGVLHMGHGLNMTLQDICVRYHRMKGFNTCWMPGTDHAGIATQNVVEKELAGDGVSRHELGREKFVEKAWEWKEKHGNAIIHQLKRLGCSCDWERTRFTMDEGLSRAVREVFVRLYKEGLVYKGEYLVNWCPRCHTALSDLEVEHEEVPGSFWHIRYPRKDGKGDVVVATTRPETMLGDTGVAVHPEDERYRDLIGKKVILPLVDREIEVIADHRVDREFGTGAVKVTPAHDPNDFLMGNEHNLERINILTPDGKINENGVNFQGQDRFEARKNIVKELEKKNYLLKITGHVHNVGHCYRCKTIVEPYLSKQWFVKVAPLAKEALRAVKDGKTKFVPEHWSKTYYEWMENIQDWCISRQIWWGHRIPAWYCQKPTHPVCGDLHAECVDECPPIVGEEAPLRCPKCGGTDLVQDTDVLDTWFSSALWPFSTFGWPEKTPELKTFYPTSVLITGFDIIFFWVARMMMMGLKFMGTVPFKEVYIHALVRDEKGQKMSKSKGNVVDPLEMMEKFGTDAFRFTMAALAAQGRDVKLSEDRIEGYRNFCNKIWNAARFVLMNIEGGRPFDLARNERLNLSKNKALSLADKWILNRLQVVTNEVTEALDNYNFDVAARAIYRFIWHEYCDWYVELAKVPLKGEWGEAAKSAAGGTLVHVLEKALRLLHPFMPFITEEIWQTIRHSSEECETSIMVKEYPKVSKKLPYSSEAGAMTKLMDVITAIRNIRGEHTVPHSKRVDATINVKNKDAKRLIETNKGMITSQAKVKTLTIEERAKRPERTAAAVAGEFEVFVPFAGLINVDAEKERLNREISKIEGNVSRLEQKLSNKKFTNNAPAEIVEKEKARLAEAKEGLDKLKGALENLA